jgi:hypothetical protein
MTERLPWRQGPSIVAVIREWDRSADAELVLPDEPPVDPTEIRWGAGSMEGVAVRHFGVGDEEGRGVAARVRRLVGARRAPAEIVSRLKRLVRHPFDEERLALYRIVAREDVLTHVDAVLERVVADQELLDGAAPHARWLVNEARDRGPLKFGIALLGVCGDTGDVDTLKLLARHDEFTLYCSVALTNLLPDPVDALWEVARSARGWGKIEAVERLAPLAGDRPDVKRWLLTDGCENAVMNEYLGYTCATAGGLREALGGEVDDDLLDGACVIVSALCAGGPAEDLDDYADGPVVVRRLLDLLEDRCTTLERLDTVIDVKLWLEQETGDPPAEHARESAERCRAILAQPDWPERLREAFERNEQGRWIAWRAGPHVGLDLWESGFAKLQSKPLDESLVCMLMDVSDRERQRRVVVWAEQNLPVDVLASGPDRHLFPVEHPELHTALACIVQNMREGDVYSPRLVAAGLLAPVVFMRNLALNAVEARPRERWGAEAEQALERLRREEPDTEARERVVNLLETPR